MRFMQTESVLQTKNRSGPAKNRFSVALVGRQGQETPIDILKYTETDRTAVIRVHHR